ALSQGGRVPLARVRCFARKPRAPQRNSALPPTFPEKQSSASACGRFFALGGSIPIHAGTAAGAARAGIRAGTRHLTGRTAEHHGPTHRRSATGPCETSRAACPAWRWLSLACEVLSTQAQLPPWL